MGPSRRVAVILSLTFMLNSPMNSTHWAIDDEGCRTPEGGVGNCMSIKSCYPILNFLQNTEIVNKEVKNYLRSFYCGFDKDGPKVCCPSKFKLPQKFQKSQQQHNCKTKAHVIGNCVKIDSCKSVKEVFAKLNASFENQRSKGLNHFRRVNSLDSRPKEWCESSGTKMMIYLCTKLKNFLELLDWSKKYELDAARNYFQCSEDGKVCCPFEDVDPLYHPNLKLLESDCTKETVIPYDPRRRLLAFAEETEMYEFPWIATLKYSGNDGNRAFHCGATLISKRYLLTAAHCIRTRKLSLIGARLGEFDLDKRRDCETFVCTPDFNVTVNDAIVHPAYNPVTFHNDIALIRLKEDVKLSFVIQPICLPIKFQARTNTFEKDVVVIGWGLTEKGTPSSTLLKIHVPVISEVKCLEYYREAGNVTHSQMCAGGRDGQDTCKGDSGGPLMGVATMNFNNWFVQYGVVSYGLRQECGERNVPGVYTRVTSHLNWILDNIKP